MASFLTAMRMKGESSSEIAAMASVMRMKCRHVHAPEGTADLCGTGGAAVKTYNISTVSAVVVSASGVPVAKHGNRSFTSRSGSADLLEALGVNISIGPEDAATMLADAGITFLYAPLYHPATRNVIPVRRSLAFRTVFNILGPLTNPAGVDRQLVGVFSEEYLDRIAGALAILGCRRGMVVFGRIGMDEVAPIGETAVAEIRDGGVERYVIDASDFTGFGTGKWTAPATPGPEDSAIFAQRVLEGRAGEGELSPVLLNAGAALYAAGAASSMERGMGMALDCIAGGKAGLKLEEFRQASRRAGSVG